MKEYKPHIVIDETGSPQQVMRSRVRHFCEHCGWPLVLLTEGFTCSRCGLHPSWCAERENSRAGTTAGVARKHRRRHEPTFVERGGRCGRWSDEQPSDSSVRRRGT